MAMTPDDTALLQYIGVLLLNKLSALSTLTLLHDTDATIYPVDALTQFQPLPYKACS